MKGVSIDLTGQHFGSLTAIAVAEHRIYKGIRYKYWECVCACGNSCVVAQSDLRRGSTSSCGCKHNPKGNESHKFRHGYAGTRTYNIWRSLKQRCLLPTQKDYRRYGARGIIVCPAWLDSFEVFLADMGEAPEAMQIDRIDNDGPYCPFNCHWATPVEQSNNRRTNRRVTYNGRTQTIAQWAREVGIRNDFIRRRLDKGWKPEDALTVPVSASSAKTN